MQLIGIYYLCRTVPASVPNAIMLLLETSACDQIPLRIGWILVHLLNRRIARREVDPNPLPFPFSVVLANMWNLSAKPSVFELEDGRRWYSICEYLS